MATRISRKSHNKSRNGCQNCKRRHVKCDERGPPCLNCVMRKDEPSSCVFPFLRQRQQHQNPPPITTSTNSSVSSPMAPSPCSFSSSTDNNNSNNRLLELELMHRWSTHSWTCQANSPDCKEYMLGRLPRAALANGYLLSSILATAAIDLALSLSLSEHSPGTSVATRKQTAPAAAAAAPYFRAALEYATRAMAEFRTQVSALTPENIDLVFYFSGLLGIVQFALPPAADPDWQNSRSSVVDRVCDHADAALKLGRAVFEHLPWLLDSPSPTGRIVRDFPMEPKFLDSLDAGTKAALELMSAVARRVRVSTRSPTVQESVLLTGMLVAEMTEVSGSEAGPLACDVLVYKLAIGQTKYAFAEDQQGRLKGYFHTVFAVAGSSFAAAVRDREPMAMFVLLYWGVLVQRAARDPALWALVSEGRDVVAETSEFLMRSEIADVPGVREGIAWTREDAGLPPLAGCPPSAPTMHGSGFDASVSERFLESWTCELSLLLQPEDGICEAGEHFDDTATTRPGRA